MALAHVTGTKLRSNVGNSVTGAITSPTAGNLLVCVGNNDNHTSINHAFSDNQTGNTYTRLLQQITTSGGYAASSLHYAKNINSSGTFNVTFSAGSGSTVVGLVAEFSGADTTTQPDATGTGKQATATAPTTNSLTNVNANSVFVAGMGNEDTAGNTTPSGWSRSINETDGVTYLVTDLVYQIVTSAAAKTATWGAGNSVKYATVPATFQQVSAGGGGIPFFFQEEMLTGGMQALGGF